MEKVRIYIIDDQNDIEALKIDSYKKIYGSTISTKDKILVNRTNIGYSIIFKYDDFISFKPDGLWGQIVVMFAKNIPNKDLAFSIGPLSDNIKRDEFKIGIIKKFSEIMRVTLQSSKDLPHLFFDEPTQKAPAKNAPVRRSSVSVSDILNGNIGVVDSPTIDELFDPDEYDYNEDEDDEEDDEEEEKKEKRSKYDKEIMMDAYLRSISDIEDDKPKKKKDKNRYPISKVLRNCKSPKTSYKRHGVLIGSKHDMIKDMKVIKEFLKEFIPGNGWKKEFRKEVLGRWIQAYSITKKRLHKFEKKIKNEKRKERASKARMLIGSAMTLVSKSNDLWNDPNR